MNAPRRVLLVEDDPSLQRFVALALEDLPVQLTVCASVDEALAQLDHQAFDLIITDLMLPGRHGSELLAELQQRPSLRASARLAVFSAGAQGAARQALEAQGVWRVLSKPCALQELQDCVMDAASSHPVDLEQDSAASAREQAIQAHFGGQAGLYDAFRASCLRQFPIDVQQGQQALERHDAAPLRHLGHSLKSVLSTLGHPAEAAAAKTLELAAERADWPALESAWQQLRATLTRLA